MDQNTSLYGVIPQAFDHTHLDRLVEVFDRLPNQLNSGAVSKAYTNGIDSQHPLYPWICRQILPTIEQKLGVQCKIRVAMYLKEFIPWTVHSDYQKNDEFPGYAFLIPIDWDGPAGSHTHTVIFNEKSKTNVEDYIKTADIKNPMAENIVNDLCSHESPEVLKFLTLATVARWRKGDLIYWDRELLHSSDNFLSNGISSKRALVIFSEKPHHDPAVVSTK